MREAFRRFATWTSHVAGMPWVFVSAVILILTWAVTGPVFGFSDTWQLVINTSTTIVTFLMVFLIQNTQNRDAAAVHIKLDELLRAVNEARTGLVKAEELPDEKLEELTKEFEALRDEQEALEAEHEELEADHTALVEQHEQLRERAASPPMA